MQTKREAQTEQAAPREHSMAKQDIDFSGILDTAYLQSQCDAVAEANKNRPDLLRSDLLALLKKASNEGRQKARELLDTLTSDAPNNFHKQLKTIDSFVEGKPNLSDAMRAEVNATRTKITDEILSPSLF